MPTFELSDDEHAALLSYLRQQLDAERYPLSPALRPIRAVLAKLEPPKPAGRTIATPEAAGRAKLGAIEKAAPVVPSSTHRRGNDCASGSSFSWP
jgi:hypothetical protein